MMRAAAIDLASRLRDTARVDPARAPALGAILDDGAAHLAVALRALGGIDVRVTLGSAAPHEDDSPLKGAVAHVRHTFRIGDATAVAALGLAALDRIVDALFGGDGHEPSEARPRDLSSLERAVARRVLSAAMTALQTALEPVAPFAFEREGESVAGVGDPATFGSWLGIRYELAFPGAGVPLFILFPQTALQAFRANPSREAKEAAAADDPRWTSAMRDEVARTSLPIQAVLHEPGITLLTLAALRVGSVLPLRATPRTPVAVTCEGRTLFHGQFGQRDGVCTVRVGETFEMDASE